MKNYIDPYGLQYLHYLHDLCRFFCLECVPHNFQKLQLVLIFWWKAVKELYKVWAEVAEVQFPYKKLKVNTKHEDKVSK